MRERLLISPIYEWENWVTESFNNLPQVTQLIVIYLDLDSGYGSRIYPFIYYTHVSQLLISIEIVGRLFLMQLYFSRPEVEPEILHF